jgi:Uncharacterised protein, DegV family COG1307
MPDPKTKSKKILKKSIITNEYKIITDDLSFKELSEVPLKLNRQYIDIDLKKILKTKKKSIYVVNNEQNGFVFFQNLFKELLKNNKNVIYLSSTPELTNSYEDALLARSTFEEEKSRIFVINSRSISGGVVIVKSYIETLLKEGLSMNEIIPKIEKYIKKVHGNIFLKNTESPIFVKEKILFEEHVNMNNKITFFNESKLILDDLLDFEMKNCVTKIVITYSSEYLKTDATNLQNYIKYKLRYFENVEVMQDYKNLKGFKQIHSLGLFIG